MSKPDSGAPSKSINKNTLKRVFTLFAPHRAEVTVMLITVLVGVVMGLLPPYFLKVLVDEGFQQKNLQVIEIYSVATVVVTLIAATVTLLYGYQSVKIGQKIMCELRLKLFTHLQSMSLRFFTSTRTGEIQTRLISDVAGVQNVVSNTFVDAISNFAIIVSALIAMLILEWRLTLLSIALIPIFAYLGQKIGNSAKDIRTGVQEQTGEINSMMQENLSVSGALLAKTIGRADVIADKFDVENHKLAGWQVKAAVLQYVFFGVFRMITQLIPAIIYWFAGWLLVAQGDTHITIGLLLAFTGLQTRMFFPLTGLMGVQVEILSSFALFDRIFEYLDMPNDIQQSPTAKPLPRNAMRGEVTFENVGFKYDQSGDDWTLQDINFQAQPGQLVALVGPSGAGKTTLTYMIPRLYDVDAGSVKIDGVDVREMTLSDLGQAVGMVTQETYLIHTTIAENLRIAKPDATLDELIAACKAAAIHAHIDSLPEGYETVVGERGYKLSGGEKQRIAIARAILKNPPILILDEATSALDTASERLIQNSLNSLMQGRTTFAIAHRLSTIVAADQILVIDEGRVVEQGRHDELLAQNGLYSSLHQEQFASVNPVGATS